ncbi:hypothetical protein LK540_19370 [Massilia sp. IC2-278]|uniref:hypothetical protein n=1 Tax=Massilia sp. IC2-278 TaxID=2887200 RepID=UPI001E3DDA02|nr:hypothetical protein [Massilia sp. IC2-278]MCC2962592.1 hypothetical protein [Massilia sp. IC2-278]
MDANQRSEMNNQTNNGGNEKWNANAKGKTAPDAPLDHTYPQGASQQQGRQGIDQMGTQQSGMGHGPWTEESSRWDLPGGSMQTQQSGGSGPTQSITDSHQRQMEQRSQAYGQIEQPVGGRSGDSGTDLLHREGQHAGNTQATERMNPQDARQPELQGGSLGHHHGAAQPVYGSQSMQSGQQAQSAQMASAQQGNSQREEALPRSPARERQDSTDRAGSQTGEQGREQGADVHQSNDVAGGLPRSPGNAGPRTENQEWQPGASMKDEPNPVHQSNDAAGGYPKSPAGANRLAGDRKMDDDTGFSRK